MASNVTRCDICAEDDSYLEATKWCSECQQWLCENCSKYHQRVAITKAHTLLSKEEYMQLPKYASEINRKCVNHPDNDLEFYCNNHIAILCFTCMKNEHSLCKSVNKLKDVASGIKSSAAVSDVIGRMEDSIKIFENLEFDRSKNKEDLTKEMHIFDSNVKELLNEHQKHFQQLASNLRSDFMTKYNVETSALDVEKDTYLTKKTLLEKKLAETKRMVEYASDIQMFLSLEAINKEVSAHEEYLQNLDGKVSTRSLKLNLNENALRLKNTIPSYGTVSVQSVKCPVQFSGINKAMVPAGMTRQRMIPPPPNRQPTTATPSVLDVFGRHGRVFTCVGSFAIPQPRVTKNRNIIRDMKCLPNGYLAMTDTGNNRVIIIDQHGTLMLQEHLPGSPRCLTLTEDGRLAVTLYDEKTVIIWNPYQPLNKESIKVDDNCTGIVCVGSILVINCQKIGLVLHNLKNGSQRRLHDFTGQFDLFIYRNQGSDICIYKAKTRDFVILNVDTQSENGRFRIHSYTKKPSNIAKDDSENFYIIDCDGVRKISPKEKESDDIVLNESDGISKPQAVATYCFIEAPRQFNVPLTKLFIFVVNNDGESIVMFKQK